MAHHSSRRARAPGSLTTTAEDALASQDMQEIEDEGMFTVLLSYAAMKLANNALFAPFDMATVLYQVQFQPRRTARPGDSATADDAADEAETDDDDARNNGEQHGIPRKDEGIAVAPSVPPPVHAERHYLPERHFPSLPRLRGLRHAMRATVRTAGTLTQTVQDVGFLLLQPSLESLLNDSFGLDDTTPLELLDHRLPNLGTILVSHLATELLLSPLQVLRTRLIVQKATPAKKKYLGLRQGLTTLFTEEGWSGWYRGLPATLLQAAIVSLGEGAKAVVLGSVLALDRSSMAYVLTDFLWSTAHLALVYPIQTVQRRLQCQWQPTMRRGRKERVFDPAVGLSPIHYTGVVDCLQRITREEGISSLYRGFLYQWTGTVVASLLGSLARLDEEVEVERSGDVLRRHS